MSLASAEATWDLTGADGIRLAGTSFGEPGAPGVLLLHGFGQSRGAWHATATHLAAAGWHVLTVDLRGHGDSEWAPIYRFADFEDDVRRAAAQFAQRPAVIGASMGGILTLVTHADHDIAAAVGLVDVVPHFDLASGRRVQNFMADNRDGFVSLEEAADAVAAYLPGRKRSSDPSGLLRNLRLDGDRYCWKWDPRFADGVSWLSEVPQDGLEEVAAKMTERMTVAARLLTVPTLLVRGQLSDFVPAEAAEDFARLVPHARLVEVRRAGHMVAGDQNDLFTEAVVDFLDRHHPVT